MTTNKKISKHNFRVDFYIKAIVGINIQAESYEQAINMAEEKMKDGFFANGLDYLDGSYKLSGFDLVDCWDEIIERNN